MDITFILGVSILLQLTAAFLSLRLIWITGGRIAWILIAAGLSLMAIRRCITLSRLIAGDISYSPDPAAELVALVVSLLMAAGIGWIAPLFFSIRRSEAQCKLAEESLSNRLKYEELLNKISFDAININGIARFLNNSLKRMGETLGISRVYIFEYNRADATMSNTFEWVAEGITPQKDSLQNLPASAIPWWMEKMQKNEIINYEDIELIQGEDEKKMLRSQDIKSILVVPLYLSSEFYGFIGFDECKERRKWLSEDVGILCSISRIITSVIKHRRAEQELVKLRKAVETSGEVIFLTDREGIITFINPEFTMLYGFGADEVVGKVTPRILKSGKMRQENYEIFWKTILNKQIVKGELINKTKDGRLLNIESSANPILDEDGNIAGFLAIQRDITERKHLEDQLRHSQKMEAIGLLAGGIAHDFNNILTATIGYGNLLQMKMADDPLKIYVDQILTSAEKAANLTQGLLAFSRKQIIAPKSVDINGIIKRIEKLLWRIIGEDIEHKTVLTEADLTVMADSGQIEQVLMNLCTNARDAMPDGGTLTLSTQLVELDSGFIKTHGYGKEGMYALVSVSDTGMGMDEKTKERIFEPFFTTKELGRGTGLGLSIVYGIIRQHNGYINVYSELERGTTFRIYLPLIKSEVEEIKSTPLPPPATGMETILIAEDDVDVRRFMKDILEEFGYKVIEAIDGEDAVKKYNEHKDKIRLLILDVIMPKKNGREVYGDIRKISPDIKAVFTSGYTADIIHKKGIMEEGVNFISKPISPNEFLRKIREVLDEG